MRDRVFVDGGYEDRQDWVRAVLKCSTAEEAIAHLESTNPGFSVVGLIVEQEEDRSSGYPIRFVKVLWKKK